MSDQTILMLGKLIDDPSYGRDAIHIAVAPRVAAERLSPGQHVGLIGTDHAGRTDAPVGIVDPYLPAAVMKGERFFLFLYPATITSLRHEWTHPAFTKQAENAFNGGGEYAPRDPKKESEEWLRAFIDAADCPGYEEVMAKAARVADGRGDSWSDEYLHFDSDAHGEIPPEFWLHVEVVLGRPITGEKPTHFSCSC